MQWHRHFALGQVVNNDDPRRFPQRFPRLLARLFAGEAPVVMATESRGASNAKAKRELGWTPRYSSWRDGFRAAYASAAPAEQRGSAARAPVSA